MLAAVLLKGAGGGEGQNYYITDFRKLRIKNAFGINKLTIRAVLIWPFMMIVGMIMTKTL